MKINKKIITENDTIIITSLFIIGSILRIYRIDYYSFWLDEAVLAFLAKNSLKEAFDVMIYLGAEMPLHHLIRAIWFNLGDSDFVVRLLPALYSILTIPVVYYFSKYLFNRHTAFWVALLFTISPFHIYYSQEARPYTLLFLITCLSFFYFVKALDLKKPQYWIWYSLFSIMMIYTHFFGFYILCAQFLFYFYNYSSYSESLKKYLLSISAMFLAYLPWLSIILNTPGRQDYKTLANQFLQIPYSIIRFSVGYGVFVLDIQSKSNKLGLIIDNIPVLFLIGIFVGIPLIVGTLSLYKSKYKGHIILFYFYAPFITVLLVSAVIRMMEERYMIIVNLAFYLLVISGIFTFRQRLRNIFLIGLLLLTLYGTYNYYFNPSFGKTEWREAAAYVDEKVQENDGVMFYKPHMRVPFDHYFSNTYEVDELELVLYDNDTSNSAFTRIEKFLENKKRVWLIVSMAMGEEFYQNLLNEKYRLIENKYFLKENGIYIYLFDLDHYRK